ncbi:MAG: hypothetical protein JXL80_14330 [Planctomycetes bacterium]|nr:hypothetical protein [Planctomycetota bacterium]
MRHLLAGKFKGQSLKSLLLRLHRDEQGAEGLEKLLIIAAFILPLLGLLMIYKEKISVWVNDFWERRVQESEETDFPVDGDAVH